MMKISKNLNSFCTALFLIIVLSCNAGVTDSSAYVMYSDKVDDSFDISVLVPKNYSSSKKYHTVYYLDNDINSGKALFTHVKELQAKNAMGDVIYIGIGHKGDYHVLRRRDFLPPKMENGVEVKSTDINYGHADKFYAFLTTELIPKIDKKYSTSKKRSIVGHSFGGLFAYYCLFKEKRMFTNYFALSPSLWVDGNNMFDREIVFNKTNKEIPAYLYMATGTLEFANFVLTTSRQMDTLLKDRKYDGLQVEYIEKHWANHNSHVPLTMQEVVAKIKEHL